jgi:Uma2 family endonuclease
MDVFKSLPEGALAEIINNQLVTSPAPSSKHQDIVRDIAFKLTAYVGMHFLGKIYFAPIDVYLDAGNVLQPDILFISNQQLHIIEDSIKGVPDLIVEVLSPGSEKRDKKDKKAVYEKYGVKEYWIVDPVSKQVAGYQLLNNVFVDIPSEDGIIHSPLLNLTICF